MADLANLTSVDESLTQQGSFSYLQCQVEVANLDRPETLPPVTPPDTTAPVVSNVTPVAETPLEPTTPIGFDVTDSGGNLTRSNVYAYFPATGRFEVVYFSGSVSGSWGSRPAGFSPQYTGTRSTVTNGFRFAGVVRAGGWPSAPVIVADPIDAAGNEAV